MRLGSAKAIIVLALSVMAGTTFAVASEPEDAGWAFPEPSSTSNASPAAPEGGFSVPGSAYRYSASDIRNLYQAVDWFPALRVGAPRPVLQGRTAGAMACGYCHLPDGQGRPENAAIAGLPAAYIVEQVRAFHDGLRKGARPAWRASALMTQTAKLAEPDAVEAAARWFEAQPYAKAFRLIEGREIDAAVAGPGVYVHGPGGGREPLGKRIVEIPNDFARFELRDNRPGYTIFVPEGSIERGRALAETGGGGRFAPCATCHGAGLKGGLGPPLAGRYPAYLFRQMIGFSTGDRRSEAAAPMIETASKLRTGDMIALAAFASSLTP